MNKHKLSIFWFRRDLRWHDNHALFRALSESDEVLPIFVFDKFILNKLFYNDDKRVNLIFDRLQELNNDPRIKGKTISIMYGDPTEILESLVIRHNVDAVYVNTDYEPYARERDEKVRQKVIANGGSMYSLKDQLIFEKDEVLSNEGNIYSTYTHYMKKWVSQFRISLTNSYDSQNNLEKLTDNDYSTVDTLEKIGFERNTYILHEPNLDYQNLLHYESQRNIPSVDGTSNISVHLRFGMLSIREVTKVAYQYSNAFLKELIWRSFFSQILWNNPNVVNSCYKEKFNNLKWEEPTDFQKWKYGSTGFPLVDAGMIQLYNTGYMHNRVRMIAASFLVKNMGIDWRYGEEYFANLLMDYDLASNNGNWQWVAGTGSDAAPYFRVFNPITQQERYDPNFEYCKKYIPDFEGTKLNGSAILDLSVSRLRAIERYKKCK